MRKFDKDGLILCKMQGQVFEMSIETTSTSSEIFIRRFMQSIIAKSLDSGDILQTNIQPKDIFERIVEQYGESKYGSVKYSCLLYTSYGRNENTCRWRNRRLYGNVK